MNRRLRRSGAGLLAATLLAAALPARAAAESYTIVPIGDYADAIYSVAGISTDGTIAGNRTVAPGDGYIAPPWRWTPGTPNGETGTLAYLPTGGGPQGLVDNINALGACVGMGQTGGLVSKPAYWPPQGGITSISAGRYSYYWLSLNDAVSPTIVATSQSRGPDMPSYYKAGKWYELPTLGSDGNAEDVNTAGNIVGACSAPDRTAHVVLWKPSGKSYSLVDLTAEHGLVRAGRTLINEAGLIAAGDQILQESGAITRIAPPAGGTRLTVSAINLGGRVVGTYTVLVPQSGGTTVEEQWPFTCDGTAAVDLNTLLPPSSGWVLWSAQGVNDNGQIVGMGSWNGQQRAFLLTPPPATP